VVVVVVVPVAAALSQGAVVVRSLGQDYWEPALVLLVQDQALSFQPPSDPVAEDGASLFPSPEQLSSDLAWANHREAFLAVALSILAAAGVVVEAALPLLLLAKDLHRPSRLEGERYQVPWDEPSVDQVPSQDQDQVLHCFKG